MLEGVLQYLQQRTALQLAKDALDVFIVYYVVYRALLVLRGTRAMQVGVGLGMVFVLYVVARWLQLVTVLSILSALISSIILVIVVVFQNDIRRGLMRVGSRAWFGRARKDEETKVLDEVVEAATELARHRTGAIITFEQEANLDEFVGVHKGHLIDAAVTRELLVSLFIPEAMNKLHDGAVIIRNLRIAKAGVFFPMPEGRVVDESFGSRHRAALGITEETDAVVVVVSEERGTISFCFNGNIASNLDGPKLRTMLEAIFSPKARKKKRRPTTLASARASQTPASSPAEATPISSRRSLVGSPPPPPAEVDEETAPLSLRPQRISITELPASLRARPSRDGGRPLTGSEPPPPLRRSPAGEPSTRPPVVTPTIAHLTTPLAGRVEPNPEPDDDAPASGGERGGKA
ncbi:MAG: diadenylate cyclase CdaA [Sorangiineae bacterium]|nr:diadenylate cyclase CdaA [Sorangiineae bacterium]